MGLLRLVVFFAALALVAEAVTNPGSRTAFATGAALVALVFAGLVRYNARLSRERRRARDLAELNAQAAYRVERDWKRLSTPAWGDADADDALADLDVFGRDSLVALFPPVSPAVGRACLRSWLSNNAAIDEISRRHESIRELVAEWAFRDDMAVYGQRITASAERIEKFRRWAGTPAETTPSWLIAASFVVPAATAVCIALQVAGLTAVPVCLIPIILAIAISGATHARTRARLRPAFEMAATAEAYADMLALVEGHAFGSPKLSALQAALKADGGRAAGACFRRLADIATSAETIASPMLHVALQAGVLWDVHTARRLDAWASACGGAVGRWLEALGEIESLTAFATLAHGNPDWTFPDLHEGAPVELRADALGHPLLASRSRVANDVVIGPPGTVQLISGSNMSGKSTLLRAIGLNIVLARAGAPVCAASMRCPMVQLHTSIRIHDSLLEGVSYFMAELRRLKIVIDAADGAGENTAPILYLIDEILRGTNSEERAVAARLIVQRLVEAGAIGVVTTHDLGIFADPAVAPYVRHHHFRETIEASSAGEEMRFDYHLHAGPTTSRNALRLLALVGITPTVGHD